MSLNLGILLHRTGNRNENSDRVNIAGEKNPGDKSEIKVESIIRPEKQNLECWAENSTLSF